MLGARAGRGHAAQIDDPFDPGGGRRLAEALGGLDFPTMIVGPLAHAVHQVQRRVTAGERASTRGRVVYVALHPLELGSA